MECPQSSRDDSLSLSFCHRSKQYDTEEGPRGGRHSVWPWIAVIISMCVVVTSAPCLVWSENWNLSLVGRSSLVPGAKTWQETMDSRCFGRWGISSNGRAPAQHAGGTGIDARILQVLRSRSVQSLCSWKGSHFAHGLIVTLTNNAWRCSSAG